MTGVDRCLVGYAGGVRTDPHYQNIQDYTEALLIEFDPSVTSFAKILQLWRTLHAPYPSKRQYRSAIMYLNKQQAAVAMELCGGEKFVDIEPATNFFMAEEYHQDYLKKVQSYR